MPATMKDFGLDQLNAADRLALVEELWDSIVAEDGLPPLSETQCRELDRRLAAHQAHPEAAIPWDRVEAEARARLRP
jgi:putative addiction module component (TIGR02574 family)